MYIYIRVNVHVNAHARGERGGLARTSRTIKSILTKCMFQAAFVHHVTRRADGDFVHDW
jgi:hypothetical protein